MGGVLGSVMSLVNIYVGLKTGWGQGVAITASILSFSIWKGLRKLDGALLSLYARLHLPGWARLRIARSDMTILENNCMQSTASSAGYSTGGTMVSAIAAWMLINDQSMGTGLLMIWVFFLAVLGVTLAILIGGSVGVVLPLISRALPEKWRWVVPSPMGMGMAFTFHFYYAFNMFIGAVLARLMERSRPQQHADYTVPVASGFIAGESLVGVGIALAFALGWVS